MVATFGALVLVQLIRHGGADSPAYLIGYYLSGAMAQVRAPRPGRPSQVAARALTALAGPCAFADAVYAMHCHVRT